MSEKLHYYDLQRRMLYSDAFGYASSRLLRRNVMIINADCYLGKGFEKLKPELLQQGALYALSRHERPEAVKHCGAFEHCGENSHYHGAHDAYLFHLRKPLSEDFLNKVGYTVDMYGMEQVLLYYLRQHEDFTIKNPCKILEIVHHHCSKLRHPEIRVVDGQMRLDNYLGLRSGTVPYHLLVAPFSGL